MITNFESQSKKPPIKGAGAGDIEAIAKYLVRLGDDLRSGRKSGWESASGEATSNKPRPVLPMNWNRMHVLSRVEICLGAALSAKIARQQWKRLEPWLQFLLAESTLIRSRGRIALRGDQPVAWEREDAP